MSVQAPPANTRSANITPVVQGAAGSKRLLIVDDEPDLRKLIVRALSASYTIYEAADGLEAFELVGQIALPDLIVSDVMMPRLDGFGLARKLKGYPAFAKIPIILLTAKTDPKSVVEGINAGARHYIQKPFKLADLLARVQKLTK